jgi:biotin transport system substrate-specific component
MYAIGVLSLDTPLKRAIRDVCVGFLASFLFFFISRVSIPLFFTPVPLAVQMNLVLLLPFFINKKRSVYATVFFILQGALGFSVFANGSYGMSVLLGSNGGYILGYLLAACLVGDLIERGNLTTKKAYFIMLFGNLVVWFLGGLWLSFFVGGIYKAFLLGVLPFIPGDFIKLALSIKLLKRLKKI